MKVWLALEHIPYEGDTVLGVFSTEERALDFLVPKRIDSYIGYSAEAWEVDPIPVGSPGGE